MTTGTDTGAGTRGGADGTINLRRKPRLDGLPEHMTYADTGCPISPTCLHCPLAHCRYDEPVGHSGEGKGGRPVLAGRDVAIWARYREMETTIQGFREAAIPVIAAEFGVGPRTVFRVVAKARKALGQVKDAPA